MFQDDDYIYRTARQEVERLEEAKRKRLASSEQSFGNWLGSTVEKVGRAVGYVISIPIRVVSSIWKWLFG